MNKLKPYAWLLVAGIALSLLPFITKELHLGIAETRVITRAEALESGALYLLGALGALLLVGVILSVKGNAKGKLICRFWGAIYGLVMVPFSYIQFGVQDPLSVIAMVAFSVVWYYWANKVAARANA
jgi:hypothetical protein